LKLYEKVLCFNFLSFGRWFRNSGCPRTLTGNVYSPLHSLLTPTHGKAGSYQSSQWSGLWVEERSSFCNRDLSPCSDDLPHPPALEYGSRTAGHLEGGSMVAKNGNVERNTRRRGYRRSGVFSFRGGGVGSSGVWQAVWRFGQAPFYS